MEGHDKITILHGAKNEYVNLSPAALVNMAIARGEGMLTNTGALRVETGKYTGRSPHDKFIVKSPKTEQVIDWSANKPFSEEQFTQLYNRMMGYIQNRDIFVFNGYAGADREQRVAVRFINEFAWQNLFVHQLFIRPAKTDTNFSADFTLICLPEFKAIAQVDGTNSEAFIILNMEKRIVLIGGTHYGGEMKKSIFTLMNFLLPARGVMPMHCSANVGEEGDVALFFGLSGTGKTTLSADHTRGLIGDDEHGWSDSGIFNFEGGCYAKCIRLQAETEPQIWEAIKFGAVLENVVVDNHCTVNYDCDSITENTRVAYPIDHISNAVSPSLAGHPKTVLFLTADAFGVLPPIAKLTKEQAMYHFLSGYTSKVAGTERGITEPEATFSACFGAPFLPLSPLTYAKLLGEKLEQHDTNVFLINTGWSGGPHGVGKRIKLSYTRAMVSAALEGQLNSVAYEMDPVFNVFVPQSCPGVDARLLNPRNTWDDKTAYDQMARRLAELFAQNIKRFAAQIPLEILAAGPEA